MTTATTATTATPAIAPHVLNPKVCFRAAVSSAIAASPSVAQEPKQVAAMAQQ